MEAAPFALSSPAPHAATQATLFDLSIGEPQRVPFPSALVHDAVFRERINHYGSSLGNNELRELIREQYYPGLLGNSHELMISHGAINGIDLILRAFIRAGDEVLIPDPCFPPYHALTRYADGTPVSYPLLKTPRGFFYSVQTIRRLINEKTRIVIINSPHNPTGALLDPASRDELATLFRENPRVLFISDEVYSKIIHDGAEHHSVFDVSDQGFVINSLSKSHALQGLRIGWIMATHQLMQPILALLQNTVGCVSSIGQEMAKKILQSNSLANPDFTSARNLATKILQEHEINFIMPKSGFFVLIAVDNEQNAIRDLARDGIKVVPGSLFGAQSRGYIRACFAQTDKEIGRSFLQVARSMKKKLGPIYEGT